MSNKKNKATDFQVYLKQQLKDSEFKELYTRYGKQLKISFENFCSKN